MAKYKKISGSGYIVMVMATLTVDFLGWLALISQMAHFIPAIGSVFAIFFHFFIFFINTIMSTVTFVYLRSHGVTAKDKIIAKLAVVMLIKTLPLLNAIPANILLLTSIRSGHNKKKEVIKAEKEKRVRKVRKNKQRKLARRRQNMIDNMDLEQNQESESYYY